MRPGESRVVPIQVNINKSNNQVQFLGQLLLQFNIKLKFQQRLTPNQKRRILKKYYEVKHQHQINLVSLTIQFKVAQFPRKRKKKNQNTHRYLFCQTLFKANKDLVVLILQRKFLSLMNLIFNHRILLIKLKNSRYQHNRQKKS